MLFVTSWVAKFLAANLAHPGLPGVSLGAVVTVHVSLEITLEAKSSFANITLKGLEVVGHVLLYPVLLPTVLGSKRLVTLIAFPLVTMVSVHVHGLANLIEKHFIT